MRPKLIPPIVIWPFVALLGVVGLWVADRTPPTAVYSVEVVTERVAPGSDLRIRYNVTRTRSCATYVERVLLDSERVLCEF